MLEETSKGPKELKTSLKSLDHLIEEGDAATRRSLNKVKEFDQKCQFQEKTVEEFW